MLNSGHELGPTVRIIEGLRARLTTFVDRTAYLAQADRWLLAMVLIFVCLVYLVKAETPYFISVPPREAQTASQTRFYYEHGIDLLHPTFDLTPTPEYLALEFPIYQASVAVLYHMFGFDERLGKLLNIAFMAGTLYYFYRVACRVYANRLVAAAAPLFFAILPFSVRFVPTFLADPFVLLLSLAALHHALSWAEQGRPRDLWILAIAGALACVVKLVVFMPVCIPLLLILFPRFRAAIAERRYSRAAWLVAIAALWAAAAIAWAIWAQDLNTATVLQAFDAKGFSEGLRERTVGTLSMRTSPHYVDSLLQIYRVQFLPAWLPAWAWVILLAVGALLTLARPDRTAPLILWSYLAGFAIMLAVFFPAIATHNYYGLPAVPIMTLSIFAIVDYVYTRIGTRPLLREDLPPLIRLSYSLCAAAILAGIGWLINRIDSLSASALLAAVPNYDGSLWLLVSAFAAALCLLAAGQLLMRRAQAANLCLLMLAVLIGMQYYSNTYWGYERWWEKTSGYHWTITPLLVDEVQYIHQSMQADAPIMIVGEYAYYPHVLYMAEARGYTVAFPNETGAGCLSASGFPKCLSADSIDVMYQQGVRDVFVMLYDPNVDMTPEEFAVFADQLGLQYVGEWRPGSQEPADVLHYAIPERQ